MHKLLLGSVCAILVNLTGCDSSFLKHALYTQNPITITAGYLGTAKPPLTISWYDATRTFQAVDVFKVMCNNIQHLLPGRTCIYPREVSELQHFSTAADTQGEYAADDIIYLSSQLPGEDTDLRVLFLDGYFKADENCPKGHCYLAKTIHRGSSSAIAISLPEITKSMAQQPITNFQWTFHTPFKLAVVGTHEAGHALGLVNNGTPMVTDHESTSGSPYHCNNQQCVMHEDTGDVGQKPLTWAKKRSTIGPAADIFFDENCTDDVRSATDN